MADRWTVADVPDCAGKTVAVTGANSGIGFEAAKVFTQRGATVIMACRNETRATDARDRIESTDPDGRAVVELLDLADLDSVASFADRVDDAYDRLDVLCNNAGVMAIPRSETADGFETQFGVNHLGHFALTGLLLDRLRETPGQSRVVTVSSGAHTGGTIHFDDINHERSYSKWGAYAQSKLANLLFAYELQRRLDADGESSVLSVGVHPGYADTDLQRRGPEAEGSTLKLLGMKAANAVFGQSPRKGALPIVYAATAEDVTGGEYVGPGGPFNMRGYPTKQESSDASRDPGLARRLWTVSEELTGITYDLPEPVAVDDRQ